MIKIISTLLIILLLLLFLKEVNQNNDQINIMRNIESHTKQISDSTKELNKTLQDITLEINIE